MILRQHPIDRPIKGRALAAQVRLPYRTTGELAAFLTCEGTPIGCDSGRGYYWARVPEDMDPKIHELDARIIGNATHRKGAKKVRRRLEREQGIERPRTQLPIVLSEQQLETDVHS